MSSKDEFKYQYGMGVVKLMNNYLKELRSISYELNLNSVAIEGYITKLVMGDVTTKAEFTHLITRAIELTKADPFISVEKIEEEDDLLILGKFILDILKLPYGGKKKVNCVIAAFREFQKALAASIRRATHQKDLNFDLWTEQLLTKHQIVEHTTVIPQKRKLLRRKESKQIEFKKGGG